MSRKGGTIGVSRTRFDFLLYNQVHFFFYKTKERQHLL